MEATQAQASDIASQIIASTQQETEAVTDVTQPDDGGVEAAETPADSDPSDEPATGPEARTPTSRALALAVQKERQLRRQREEIEHRESQLKTQEEKYAKIAEAMAKSGEDPRAFLEAAGMDPTDIYNRLTKQFISDTGQAPELQIEALQKQIAELRSEIKTDKERTQQTQQQQQREYLVGHYGALAKSDPDKYEMINIRGKEAAEACLEVVLQNAEMTGEYLSDNDAMDLVESYLRADAEKLASAKWLAEKFAAQKQAKPQQRPQEKPGLETLTNDLTASRPNEQGLPLNDDQEFQEFLRRHQTGG